MVKEYTPGKHRNEDPDTSVDAANSIDAARLEQMAYAQIKKAGMRGLTAEECATRLGMELGSVTPRMAPLRAKGFITYLLVDDARMRRPGKSGRGRDVLVAIENLPTQPELFTQGETA